MNPILKTLLKIKISHQLSKVFTKFFLLYCRTITVDQYFIVLRPNSKSKLEQNFASFYKLLAILFLKYLTKP